MTICCEWCGWVGDEQECIHPEGQYCPECGRGEYLIQAALSSKRRLKGKWIEPYDNCENMDW